MKKIRKHKSAQVVPTHQRNTPARKPRLAYTVWHAYLGLVSILSFIQFLARLPPQVELSKSETLDPADALTALFTVSPHGPLPISNVHAYCDVHDIGLSSRFRFLEAFSVAGGQSSFVGNGDQWTIPCPFNERIKASEGTRVLWADVTVRVTFDYFGSLWHGTKYQRFKTETNKDGLNIWLAVPSPRNYRPVGAILE